MERNECVKMENPTYSFMDYYYSSMNNNTSTLTGLLDYSTIDGEKNNSLGFMELLNMQDFGPNSVFDVLQGSVDEPTLIQTADKVQVHQEPSKVLNAPATPNCSSISSESSGGQNDEQNKHVVLDDEEEEEDEDEEEEKDENEHQKTKKQLKTKKTTSQKKKRQREPRFAFMTKSEVDHLEDGYRWRKYGQKAVKNSPFPRSYYRCTSATCNVKKRVERSFNDPSVVVTTYEGQHTHPSPVMPRSGPASAALPPYSGYSYGGGASSFTEQMFLSPHNQLNLNNFSLPLNHGYMGYPNAAIGAPPQMRICSPSSAVLTDHGLLQDIMPWSSGAVKKEE